MARYSEKVKLKRSNLEVTRMGLGTAPLGGLFKSVTDEDGEDLLNTALDLGINYFDTAPQYGHGVAEMRVGKALQKTSKPFVIETKVGRVLRYVEGVEPEQWFPDAPRNIVPIYDYSKDGIKQALMQRSIIVFTPRSQMQNLSALVCLPLLQPTLLTITLLPQKTILGTKRSAL